MSGLTPESARAAADWLEKRDASMWLEKQQLGTGWWARDLRAEADRLEVAAKTPGQALAEHQGMTWLHVPPSFRVTYEDRAAAVIAHVVGPDRVVVDRVDALGASKNLDHSGYHTLAGRIAKALS